MGEQFLDRFPHRGADVVEIGLLVRGGQEEVAQLPDEHATVEQIEVERVHVRLVLELEERGEPLDLDRHVEFTEVGVQLVRERRSPAVEAPLQFGSRRAEVVEDRLGRHHGQRMLVERAAEEGGFHPRSRVVAEVPDAAVDRVHDPAASGDHAQRHAAAHDLSVGGQIGLDSVQSLDARRMATETRDHLVEDEFRTVRPGDLPERAKEVGVLHAGSSQRHRLGENRREFRSVLVDEVESVVCAELEHVHVLHRERRDTRCERLGAEHAVLVGRYGEHAVEVAVVRGGENYYLVAAGRGACEPDRGHDRFRAAVEEGDAVHTREFEYPGGDFLDQLGARSEAETDVQPLAQGRHDDRRIVAEEVDAVAQGEVDVLVSVDVPQAGALPPFGDDRVKHLLGRGAKTDRGPAVGDHRPEPLREFLGALGPTTEAVSEFLQIAGALCRLHRTDRAAARARCEGHHRLRRGERHARRSTGSGHGPGRRADRGSRLTVRQQLKLALHDQKLFSDQVLHGGRGTRRRGTVRRRRLGRRCCESWFAVDGGRRDGGGRRVRRCVRAKVRGQAGQGLGIAEEFSERHFAAVAVLQASQHAEQRQRVPEVRESGVGFQLFGPDVEIVTDDGRDFLEQGFHGALLVIGHRFRNPPARCRVR